MDWRNVQINYAIGRVAQYGWPGTGYKLAEFDTPAYSVMMADCRHVEDSGSWGRIGWPRACRVACTPSLETEANTLHNGGSDICFVDGHAKWYKAQAIKREWGRTIKPGR